MLTKGIILKLESFLKLSTLPDPKYILNAVDGASMYCVLDHKNFLTLIGVPLSSLIMLFNLSLYKHRTSNSLIAGK